jgi:cytochrome c oxidase subunit I
MESASLPISAAPAAVIEASRVKKLALYYIAASTTFFFVSGLLGVMMRESQANLATLDPKFFYAIMTAHGLGAFVAWAAFAVMGLSFWVFHEVDFPMRKAGFVLAWATWWLMVIGVAGIVVTTLLMSFGASWVFLYPLPFNSSGDWSDAATGIFSFSVLLVGVSIITWCLAIVHTAIGPGLRARSDNVLNRIGCALGFGYILPKRFAMDRDLPYPVIPLTVIGLDMVIATLPLAVLLVFMVAQSIDPSVSVDPLLAKNMLWWFGHPVVYLLLFPAVAIYYLLIPRFAGRELVAGRIVAFAWFIAVIVNVIVWAHHIYLDYPQETIQGTLNVAMQPLTFTIVAPSAISLYSLSATVWRSNFQWTPAAKFLAVALTGWLVAGMSGVINATIAFDVVVHNTLWIVGHFHNMALLNIGLVVFAGIYAFLPQMTGKEWYSDKLANSHLWMTTIGGYGMCLPMLIQGLDGAPRRYAVLPSQYEGLTRFTVPFVLLMALGQLVFLYNLVRTLQGAKRKPVHETVRNSFAVTGAVAVVALGASSVAFAVDPGGKDTGGGGGGTVAGTGKQLFTDNCGSCHTLKAAGTSGTVGPNLDQLKPTKPAVLAAIAKGGAGSGTMPKDIVTGKDAEAVAAYVADSAGK